MHFTWGKKSAVPAKGAVSKNPLSTDSTNAGDNIEVGQKGALKGERKENEGCFVQETKAKDSQD